jgi:hypothetical protein
MITLFTSFIFLKPNLLFLSENLDVNKIQIMSITDFSRYVSLTLNQFHSSFIQTQIRPQIIQWGEGRGGEGASWDWRLNWQTAVTVVIVTAASALILYFWKWYTPKEEQAKLTIDLAAAAVEATSTNVVKAIPSSLLLNLMLISKP